MLLKKEVCTFILETAHNVCRWHSSAVIGKSVVELQHVLGQWLFMGSEGPGLGPQPSEVQRGQKLVQKVLCTKEWIVSQIHTKRCPVVALTRLDWTAPTQTHQNQ